MCAAWHVHSNMHKITHSNWGIWICVCRFVCITHTHACTCTQKHTFIIPASLQIALSIWCSVKCELNETITALGKTHTHTHYHTKTHQNGHELNHIVSEISGKELLYDLSNRTISTKAHTYMDTEKRKRNSWCLGLTIIYTISTHQRWWL